MACHGGVDDKVCWAKLTETVRTWYSTPTDHARPGHGLGFQNAGVFTACSLHTKITKNMMHAASNNRQCNSQSWLILIGKITKDVVSWEIENWELLGLELDHWMRWWKCNRLQLGLLNSEMISAR